MTDSKTGTGVRGVGPIRYALGLALKVMLDLIRTLPFYAPGVFLLASIAFLLTADPETVTFADYVRAVQGLRVHWVGLTLAVAVLGTAWRMAFGWPACSEAAASCEGGRREPS